MRSGGTQFNSSIWYTRDMRWQKLAARLVAVFMAILMVMPVKGAYAQFCPSPQSATDAHPAISTAIGCLPVEIDQLVITVLPWLFGVLGGISFLLMIYGFILIATSGGDPKAVQGAWETVTSAIEGLVFAIFSLFILRLIMLQILHIPGIN